jgi:hypothetical protein
MCTVVCGTRRAYQKLTVRSAARLVVKDRPAGSVALACDLDLEDEFLLGVHGDPRLATFSPGRLRKEVMLQNFGLLDLCTHWKQSADEPIGGTQ